MGDSETHKLEEQLAEQLAELREWVTTQPHIPKDMDDKLLRRFPHSCYYDVEKAKRALEAFTSIRTSSPELFCDRDPLAPRAQKALEIVRLAQYRISGNRNLWIIKLIDPGLKNFDHTEFIRNCMLAFDAWFLEEDHLQEEDISIFDARDMCLKIFWKLKLSVARKFTQYQEEGLPIRVKQMHMLNAPYFIDKLFAFLKQFMSKEMTDMFHFHVPGSDTLYEFFSKDELPEDFGGNLESMDCYHKRVVQKIYKHRELLIKDDLWRTPQEKPKNN